MVDSQSRPLFGKRGLVYGWGINDYPYSTKNKGVEIKSYRVWKDMLKRCLSELYKSKYPSYQNVTICESWKYFSNFLNDVSDMRNAFRDGYQLDKDLLSDDVRIYSKDTVCFIPDPINLSLTNRSPSLCQSGVVGVRLVGDKYQARLRDPDGTEKTVAFNTIEEAASCYREHRKNNFIKVVDAYKDDLDDRVLSALYNYEFL